jgi:hypothetical protein
MDKKTSPNVHWKFVEVSGIQNFGFRSGTIGVAARETGHTSGTIALRATLAYIYNVRV